jgi:hypothetical protein
MNAVDAIARAVLYEGYMLYPYRPSAIKNRQRFNFGVLYPQTFSDAQGGSETCTMQTQCLVLGNRETYCEVRVRFLRMVTRSVSKVRSGTDSSPANVDEMVLEKTDRIEADGRIYQGWQEAAEEESAVPVFRLSDLAGQAMIWPFQLPGARETEAIRDGAGKELGVVRREKQALTGVVECSAEVAWEGMFRLTVRVSNCTNAAGMVTASREEALALAFVSTHTILEVRGGEFVSLIDPPEQYAEPAKLCQNIGAWPVLVGDEGQRDTMLSSPIILYDYPQVAPESPGDLFDGAEIDEILSLRIMTMTDEEKREMRDSDDRARQVLERTETLPEDQLIKLHGALRGLRACKGATP